MFRKQSTLFPFPWHLAVILVLSALSVIQPGPIQSEALAASDYASQAYWYRKAAEQGHAEAQYNLGIMLHTGDGIPQDKAQGVQWLRKAAAQGYPEAQEYLEELPKAESGQ